MERLVRHFSLHHIAGTELRIISDVDTGVIPMVQVEEEVIRGYVERTAWPHRCVSLFILKDLQPLVRQVPGVADLPPGGAIALAHRPIVNVYDLADLTACHIFVNQRAMEKEGYWDDLLALRGLLAHEHAHPLAENRVVRASRRLNVELSWQTRQPMVVVATRVGGSSPVADEASASRQHGSEVEVLGEHWPAKLDRLLTLLVDKLCVYAPREIFANEVAIRSDFDAALLHLNRRNVVSAMRSVEGRQTLQGRLQEEARKQNFPRSWVDLFMLIADMKGYLDMALEVAPFYRAGRESAALEVEAGLSASIFPSLEREVATAYEGLRDQYIALAPEASTDNLVRWSQAVVRILAQALKEKALELRCRVRTAA